MNKLSTIIAGGRNVTNPAFLEAAIASCGWVISEVVCGKALGADTLGELWGRKNGVPVKEFKPDWNDLSHPDAVIRTNGRGYKYDARAGIRRNHEMGDYAEAAIVLWDGQSRGSKDMIDYATKKGLKVFVFRVDKQ